METTNIKKFEKFYFWEKKLKNSVLELHGRSVYLYEVAHKSLHDPLGMDRLLSCGAALEHIVLAIRAAGWHAKVVFPSDHANPSASFSITASAAMMMSSEGSSRSMLPTDVIAGAGDRSARGAKIFCWARLAPRVWYCPTNRWFQTGVDQLSKRKAPPNRTCC